MSSDSNQAASDLEVFVLGSHWDGLPSMSPFGIKLATWVRMVGLPHELRIEDDPRKGPKKKSPWIVDQGKMIGDSELIVEHLKKTRHVDPDAGLGALDRARGVAVQRMFEEHFAQVLDYSLFTLDIGWEQSKAHFDFLPGLIRPLIIEIIRKDCRKDSWTRGIGRHDKDEIAWMAQKDIEAAATLLGDQPYFLGTEPTSTDCSVYGFLAITLWAPIPYFAQEELKKHRNLVDWCERMRDRYWATQSSRLQSAAA